MKPWREVRPSTWAAGFRAGLDGAPAEACPIQSTRGGFRAAWLDGHEAALAGEPPPAELPASAPPAKPRPAAPDDEPEDRPGTIQAGRGHLAAEQEGERAARQGIDLAGCPYGLEDARRRSAWRRGCRRGWAQGRPGCSQQAPPA